MTWVAVGVGGGAVLGGIFSGIGSSNAANTQANASEQAAGIQQNEFNTITQQESPYMQAGYGALGSLDYLLGVNPITAGQAGATGGGIANINSVGGVNGNLPAVLQGQQGYYPPTGSASGAVGSVTGASLIPSMGALTAANGGTASSTASGASGASGSSPSTFGSLLTPFTASQMQQYSPAYQFQMQQGQQGTLNGSASGQGALSGAAQQALVGFNQNYANTAFNNAFNQYQTQQNNTYNRLADVAQLGQTSAANTGQQGTSLAGSTGQAISNVGTAQAAGQVGVANAISGSLGTLGSLGAYYGANGTNGANSGYLGDEP